MPKIRTSSGKYMECKYYTPATFRKCVTCKHWCGARYFDMAGTKVLGMGYDEIRSEPCSAPKGGLQSPGGNCPKWSGFQ